MISLVFRFIDNEFLNYMIMKWLWLNEIILTTDSTGKFGVESEKGVNDDDSGEGSYHDQESISVFPTKETNKPDVVHSEAQRDRSGDQGDSAEADVGQPGDDAWYTLAEFIGKQGRTTVDQRYRCEDHRC